MGNLFGSDFMDFMVYKDIKEKRESEEAHSDYMHTDTPYSKNSTQTYENRWRFTDTSDEK